MIIIGAKGFAKELLEVCHQLGRTDNLVFFDNVSTDLPEQLYGQFPILRDENEVKTAYGYLGWKLIEWEVYFDKGCINLYFIYTFGRYSRT